MRMETFKFCVAIIVIILDFLQTSKAIYVPNEHESKPSYISMVKIPLYIKNPNSLQYYQNYSKVLFHNKNTNQNFSTMANEDQTYDENTQPPSKITQTTKLFPIYNRQIETTNIKTKNTGENNSEPPAPSTLVSQKVSENGAIAEETLNHRVVYKRKIDKGKQIEVYHKCPPGATGQFVYDLSCNQFLDCWKGRGSPRNCAPGTMFNPKNLECDFPDKVECITGPRKNTLLPRSLSQKSEKLQVEQVTCPEGFSGLIPNYTDCTKFIRCNNGQQNSLDCPPGTLFDFTHNICDFPQKSICFSSHSANYATENIQQSQHFSKSNCKSHEKNCYSEYREPYGYTYQENIQNSYVPQGVYYQTTYTRVQPVRENCDPRVEHCHFQSTGSTLQGQHQQFGSQTQTTSSCNPIDPSCTDRPSGTRFQWENRKDYQHIPLTTFCNPQTQNCKVAFIPGTQPCNPGIQNCAKSSTNVVSVQTQQLGVQPCNPGTQNCGQRNTYFSSGHPQTSAGQSGSVGCNPKIQNCGNINTDSSWGQTQQVYVKPCDPQSENCGQINTVSSIGHTQTLCDPSTQNCEQSITYSTNRPIQPGGQPCNPRNQNCGQTNTYFTNGHSQNVGGQTGTYSSGGQIQQFGQGVHYNKMGCDPMHSNCNQQGFIEHGSNVLGQGQVSSQGDGVSYQVVPTPCNPQFQNCLFGQNSGQSIGSGGFGSYHVSQGSQSVGNNGRVPIRPNSYGGDRHSSEGSNAYHSSSQTGNFPTSAGGYANVDTVNYHTICNINGKACQQQNRSFKRNQTTSSSTGNPKCPRGYQGIIKHPTNCKKFLNCANGITYIQDCAEGTLFNPSSGICDFPYNFDCENGDETTTVDYRTDVDAQYGNNDRTNFYGHSVTTEINSLYHYQPTPTTQPSYNNQYFTRPTAPSCAGVQCSPHNFNTGTGYEQSTYQYGQTVGTHNNQYNHNQQYPASQKVQPGSVHVQNSGSYGANTRFQEQQFNHNQHETAHSANQHVGAIYQQGTTSSSILNVGTTSTESHIFKVPSKGDRHQTSIDQVPDYVDVFDPSDNKNLYARSTSTTQKPLKIRDGSWPPPFPVVDTNADYIFEYEDGEPVTLEPENIYLEKNVKSECGRNDFFCSNKDCVPKTTRCNGVKDCTNGKDEIGCHENLEKFQVYKNSRLDVLEKLRWDNISSATCAVLCLETTKFDCKSFNYRKIDKTCFLTDKNIGLSGALKNYYPCDYYELKIGSLDCSQMHTCPNGKCLTSDQVCNGINDCGDRADEKGCRASDFGYNIKLAGGNRKNEGRIEVTVFGQTGYICDDQFDMKDANTACKELGYALGALEIRGNSYFAKDLKEKNTLYMMDDIDCLGNETSLVDCDFAGWGIHNCKDQEIVGVVCRTPEEKCGKNYWKCDSLNECVPIDFVCDGLYDCSDNSDEDNRHCEAPTELRLVNGSNSNEGRIEIKHHGIWGTICDDDFNDDAAKVVCKYLGYVGVAKVKKDGIYGAGDGPIWLDQVSCYGNETSLEECTHWKWGEHNCDHSEDVGIICSNDVNEVEVQRHSKAYESNPGSYENSYGQTLEPVSCGYRKDNIFLQEDEVHFRVVQGSVAKIGDYPWQAAIRVKRQDKSAHWCGAVVISSKWVLTAAHCLDGYPKGAYVVVAGEYNTDEKEGTEQQAFIEEYYLHENFRQGHKMANDVALIKLKGHGFRLNQDIQPICLPDEDANYEDDLNCTISGFGSIQSGSAVYSHNLRAAWIPIQKMDICKMAHIYGKSITEGMICAGYLDGGVDACDGDSGGPLACLDRGVFTLYGLTSWGQRCGIANKPGVYVKVSHYRKWIDRIIKHHS